MIEEPGKYVEAFRKAGADLITVHYEACRHLHRDIQLIHSTGAKAGVALNPHTPIEVLEEVIEDLDLVLLMSVNPGFGGQSFIPQTLEKLREAKQRIIDSGRDIRLEVDGGIKVDNIAAAAEAGADMFVAGSAIFNQPNYKSVIDEMRQQLESIK